MEFENGDGNDTSPGDSWHGQVGEQIEYNFDWAPLDTLGEAEAKDLVSAEFAAKLLPLQSSNDNSQFIVVITPKGRDIYLPTLGEFCHIKIPGIKPKNRTVSPDLNEVTESIIDPVRAYADDMDASFVTSVREQLLKVMDPEKGADTCFTDQDIIDLRYRRDWDDGPEDHKARIHVFVETHAQLLLCETPENPTTDEEVWFPATRMDSKVECMADDAQVYLASCPLEPKGDTGNVRKPVSVDLPFVELEKSIHMDDYMRLVVEEQADLKAIIRRDTSDKTIREEVSAVNALHNPLSTKTALIGDQSVEAFRYLQTFKAKNRPIKCYSCAGLGHKAGDCPNKPPRTCYSCGSEDHVNKDCPTPRCKQCRELGHMRKDCPSLRCNRCGQLGHTPITCQNRWVYCKNCLRSGHVAEDCQSKGLSLTKFAYYTATPGSYRGWLSSRQARGGNAYGARDALAFNPRIRD